MVFNSYGRLHFTRGVNALVASKVFPIDQIKVPLSHPDQGQVVRQNVFARDKDLFRVGGPDLVDVEATFGNGLHCCLFVFERLQQGLFFGTL